MIQKHSDNFDLLRYLRSKKNDGHIAPYYLASETCLEDLKITNPFKNYFYTIGLYYGEGARIRIGTTDYDLTRGSLLTIGPGMTCQWLNTSFPSNDRSEEHTSELQSRENLVCRL